MARIEKPAIILGILSIILIIIVLTNLKESAPGNSATQISSTTEKGPINKSEPDQPTSSDCQLVNSLKDAGFITKMNEEEIQIDGFLWNYKTSLDGKRSIVYMLHVCYRPTFKLIDNKTGKTYAEYDIFNGIVIEQ